MKRLNNLYATIVSVENLYLADQKARLGKSRQHGVREHDLSQEANIHALHVMLRDKTYRTSAYSTFIIFEPKRREIYRLPYFPDRITHHAVMNVLESVWMSLFTNDTYSCIKGKGVHSAGRNLREALRDEAGTRFCLKMDIRKFYPSVNHGILKQIVRKKIKDRDLLWLLDSIIDSAEGLPIGNYLSQYLANLYLTYFDHWIKETMLVKHYFRYCDDLVILSGSKAYLHQLQVDIDGYLQKELKLTVKRSAQVFPVASRSIDFVGYRFYHTHTMLRKRIKQNFARAVARKKGRASIASYLGWAKHANCKHLVKKLLCNESDQKLQGIRHNGRVQGNGRRQNKNIENTEQGNSGPPVQHRAVQVHRERERAPA